MISDRENTDHHKYFFANMHPADAHPPDKKEQRGAEDSQGTDQ
jgi:hypothetical protein